MKINFDSELMENQTHAVVMAPDIAFEALQSQNGGSLFFSIGTDGVFYLTRQVTAPVRFVEMVGYLSKRGVTRVLEIGPGRVLTGLVRRIDASLRRGNLSCLAEMDQAVSFVAGA